ncbi:SWIM zinc finger family protein [Streptomyces sp. NPDC051211]|uniref:SWIM zinc finger family protein n=1 Tax=Streptomyces sp. NPDC051211 TaxID=3154643 RepID=UPI00344C5232
MITARDDRRRTFDSVPPGADPATWWGRAWTEALEQLSRDSARLARGRDYAASGQVDAITVTPGRIVAYVRGSRPRPYRTELALTALTDGEWSDLLAGLAADPAALAALVEREVPRSLAERILPGPGDLLPHCSCPDTGRPPCKHAAALCYRTARLLDQDPFVLLLLRGRGERELLEELTRLNAAHAAREQPASTPDFPGIPARTALSRALAPLPAPPAPPTTAGAPPAYPGDPAAPDPLALDQLATDAAARALALLCTGEDPSAGLTLWQDAVRLASAHPTSGLTATARRLYRDLAHATGRTTTDLARAAAAWRQGGPAGLAALDEPWDPPAGPFDRARPALLAAGHGPFRPHRNHLTAATRQLRLGRDGLWYAYESRPSESDWWPTGTPSPDPIRALSPAAGP